MLCEPTPLLEPMRVKLFLSPLKPTSPRCGYEPVEPDGGGVGDGAGSGLGDGAGAGAGEAPLLGLNSTNEPPLAVLSALAVALPLTAPLSASKATGAPVLAKERISNAAPRPAKI